MMRGRGLIRGSGAATVLLLGLVVAVASGAGGGVDSNGEGAFICAGPALDTADVRVPMGMLEREAMEVTAQSPGGAGTLGLSFASSPYGLAVTADGHPRYRIVVETSGLRVSDDRRLVVWAATPDLDEVRRLGRLDDDGALRGGELRWSRFLVFVTAEPGAAESPRWEGPILLVGRAPSSRMHTMRGHGIFEAHGIGC